MEKWKWRKLLNYLPPPIAKQSKSPLIKKEFSPVHLKHCRETSDNHDETARQTHFSHL